MSLEFISTKFFKSFREFLDTVLIDDIIKDYPPQTLQGLAPRDFALSLVVLIQFLVQRFAHLQVGL